MATNVLSRNFNMMKVIKNAFRSSTN